MPNRFEIVSNIIDQECSKKYRYGQCDCFTTGLKVIDKITGSKLLAKYKGAYKSRKTAAEYMAENGFESLVDLLATHLEKIPPAIMNWGDVAVVSTEEGEHVAICAGGSFIVRGLSGRQIYSLSDVDAGFKV